jgi:hypothetical protein
MQELTSGICINMRFYKIHYLIVCQELNTILHMTDGITIGLT